MSDTPTPTDPAVPKSDDDVRAEASAVEHEMQPSPQQIEIDAVRSYLVTVHDGMADPPLGASLLDEVRAAVEAVRSDTMDECDHVISATRAYLDTVRIGSMDPSVLAALPLADAVRAVVERRPPPLTPGAADALNAISNARQVFTDLAGLLGQGLAPAHPRAIGLLDRVSDLIQTARNHAITE